MIQFNEAKQQVKITTLRYPQVCFFALDVNKKQCFISYGILQSKYKLEKLEDLPVKMVYEAFGNKVGDEIVALCAAIVEGKKIDGKLFKELKINGEEECQDEFSDILL